MIRKLKNSLFALSATGLVLAGALLVLGPAQDTPAPAYASSPPAVALDDAQAVLEGTEDPAIDPGQPAAVEATPSDAPRRAPRRHARSGFAMPYFSFAQALRGIARG